MGILERKEREREARRTAILDAAERVFKMKGFASATMDDIAREAELAKGTVYLYYKSKEELQLGLVNRGMDMLAEALEGPMQGKATAIEKILTLGESYRQFSEEHLFYFAIMHVVDLPHNPGQISEEAVLALHEKSNGVWSMLVKLLEDGKAEGTIRPEVNSLAVAMLLWMNSTAVLRFHHKVQATPDSVWNEGSHKYNMCSMDWNQIYRLNGNLLLHEVVTTRGLMYLEPVQWPTHLNAVNGMPVTGAPCAPAPTERFRTAFDLAPFIDEEMPLLYNETGV